MGAWGPPVLLGSLTQNGNQFSVAELTTFKASYDALSEPYQSRGDDVISDADDPLDTITAGAWEDDTSSGHCEPVGQENAFPYRVLRDTAHHILGNALACFVAEDDAQCADAHDGLLEYAATTGFAREDGGARLDGANECILDLSTAVFHLVEAALLLENMGYSGWSQADHDTLQAWLRSADVFEAVSWPVTTRKNNWGILGIRSAAAVATYIDSNLSLTDWEGTVHPSPRAYYDAAKPLVQTWASNQVGDDLDSDCEEAGAVFGYQASGAWPDGQRRGPADDATECGETSISAFCTALDDCDNGHFYSWKTWNALGSLAELARRQGDTSYYTEAWGAGVTLEDILGYLTTGGYEVPRFFHGFLYSSYEYYGPSATNSVALADPTFTRGGADYAYNALTSGAEFPTVSPGGGGAGAQLFQDDLTSGGDWTNLDDPFSFAAGGATLGSSEQGIARYDGGVSNSEDQWGKLRAVDLDARARTGILLRMGNPHEQHIRVAVDNDNDNYKFEVYDNGNSFLDGVNCTSGFADSADGDWVAASVEDTGQDTIVRVWNHGQTDPGDDPSTWPQPQCCWHNAAVTSCAADATVGLPDTLDDTGRHLGIYALDISSADGMTLQDWSGGDLGEVALFTSLNVDPATFGPSMQVGGSVPSNDTISIFNDGNVGTFAGTVAIVGTPDDCQPTTGGNTTWVATSDGTFSGVTPTVSATEDLSYANATDCEEGSYNATVRVSCTSGDDCNDDPQDVSVTLDVLSGQALSTGNGFAFLLDDTYTTGQYRDGTWWVLDAGGGVGILSTTPTPTGDGASLENGVEVNHHWNSPFSLDGWLAADVGNITAGSIPDLSNLQAGDSVIKVKSHPGDGCLFGPANKGGCILDETVLTIVGTDPTTGCDVPLRPPPYGAPSDYDGGVRPSFCWDVDDTDGVVEGLANLDAATGGPLATGITNQLQPSDVYDNWGSMDGSGGWFDMMSAARDNGGSVNEYNALNNATVVGMSSDSDTGGTGGATLYGAGHNNMRNATAMMSLQDFPDVDREELAWRVVQWGIDARGAAEIGTCWFADGGIKGGIKMPIVFAGVALDEPWFTSSPEIGGEDTNCFHNDGYVYYDEANDVALWGIPCTSNCDGGNDCDAGIPPNGSKLRVCEANAAGTANISNSENSGRDGGPASRGNPAHYGASASTLQPLVADQIADGVEWVGTAYQIMCHQYIGNAALMEAMNAKSLWNHPAFFDYVNRIRGAPWNAEDGDLCNGWSSPFAAEWSKTYGGSP